MLDVYSFSVSAFKYKEGIISSFPGVLVAKNDDEARGKAYALAFEEFPTSDGWSQQSCSILKIPEATFARAGWKRQ